jgi:hypothetical protein
MKKYTYILTIFASLLLLAGCAEFLEETPEGQETTASFLGDPATASDNFEQMVRAAYSTFTFTENSWRLNKHYYETMVSDWLSDDCQKGGDGSSDMPEMLDMRSWVAIPAGASSLHYETQWLVSYVGAGRANTILVLLETYKENLSTEEYNRIKGECLFLRGYFYFALAKNYGRVPYFDRPVVSEDYETAVSLSPEALYGEIEQDLRDAVDLLPEITKWTTIYPGGRATKEAARAVLARILTMEIGFGFNGVTWNDVYEQTSAIISGGNYSLISNFAEVFEYEGEMSSESVFEIPCADWGGGTGDPGGNYEVRMVTPRTQGLTASDPVTGWGWGFSTPTQDLYDEFEAGDPRRPCSIVEDGEVFYGTVLPINMDETCPTGYWNRKKAGYQPSSNTHGDKNYRVIRYAEVLLTHAEACYHLGSSYDAEAISALTEIRTRAQNSTLPKGSVDGDPDAYAPNPGTLADLPSGLTGTALLDAIKHERRVELCLEGIRTWDLIRWGEFEDALVTTIIPDDYFLGSMNPEEARANYRSHLIDNLVPTLPIPSDEVESYGIQQNPGY